MLVRDGMLYHADPVRAKVISDGMAVVHPFPSSHAASLAQREPLIMRWNSPADPPYTERVRPVRALLIYIVGVFLLGALLAPWVYWLAKWMAGTAAVFEGLANVPFHRFLNRCFLLFAVLGLWPFLRSIGADSWQAVGMNAATGNARRLFHGFLLSLASLAAIATIAMLAGSRRWEPRDEDLAGRFAGIALSAVLVSLLEELLFRGALFGALRRVHHHRLALILSSVFFSGVHFLQGPKGPIEVTWMSGLEHLAHMASRFFAAELLVPGFLSLTLVGMALALAYHRTGNLYFSLGLHAGMVFWMKAFNALTTHGPNAAGPFQFSKNGYDGWLGFVMTAAIFLAIWLGLRERNNGKSDEN
jgi:membrane protease YdiL (CAAX protease family)